jgi:hypothetical protein
MRTWGESHVAAKLSCGFNICIVERWNVTNMKIFILPLLFVLLLPLTGMVFSSVSEPLAVTDARKPVLVELFTSEGCSSCPPADRFLKKLDQQPRPGAEVIVLSEHVDYWNHIGWKDPYSARLYSERQRNYSRRFGLDSVYTPQMVVDGSSEFVGSNQELADKALSKAVGEPKIAVRLSSLSVTSNVLRAHLETDVLNAASDVRDADIYVAVALNHAQSQVSAGENAGHKLEHVAVARNITRVGTLHRGQGFAQDVQINDVGTKDVQVKLETGVDASNLRLVAFVQEAHQGRVLGAAAARFSRE